MATRVLVDLLAEARPLLEEALLEEELLLLEDLEAALERLLADLLLAERLEDVLPAAFLGAAFFAALLLVADLLAAFERKADLEAPPDFFAAALLRPPLLDLLAPFLGTFSPLSLASDKPIATACLREVTFFPLRPLFSWPLFISCMASSTFLPAPFEYLAILLDLGLVQSKNLSISLQKLLYRLCKNEVIGKNL